MLRSSQKPGMVRLPAVADEANERSGRCAELDKAFLHQSNDLRDIRRTAAADAGNQPGANG